MKDKTISLRVDVPTYAQIITTAHEKGTTTTDFILGLINNQSLDQEQTKKVKELEDKINRLQKELAKKPKQVVKEVTKVDDSKIKALESKKNDEIMQLKVALEKKSNETNKIVNEIYSLKKEIKKLTKDLEKETKRANSNANTISSLNGKLRHSTQRVEELSNFINSLDLRQHEDGFSIGGRTFSEGKRVKV